MDKQSLSEAISKATKYAKDLKHQVLISNPQILSENSISSDLNYNQITYLHKNHLPFNKTKSKIESMTFFRQSSPPKIIDKSMLNTTSKLMVGKKQVHSENERQNAFNKSQNRAQSKQISSLLAGSTCSRELNNKKNGHNYTYTHLNEANGDKFSEIDSKISIKGERFNRIRHSKSPSKQRHTQLNYTTYAEENYNSKYSKNLQFQPRSKSEQKENLLQVSKLVQEINRLQEVIKKYKCLIIQIKTKYSEMQQKIQQKVINDHFIDVLKLQIQQLQDKNNSLNLIISQQGKLINSFQSLLVEKIVKVNQYYMKQIQDTIKTQQQNEVLKKMLLIAIQNPTLNSSKLQNSCKDEVQSKVNPALACISRSIDKFTQKWS